MKKDRYLLIDRKRPNVLGYIDYEIPVETLRYKLVDTSVGWGVTICYFLDEDSGKSIAEILNNLNVITQTNKKKEGFDV